jgi:hypothetical protein
VCACQDPSGAIIVVKFLCKNSDFITTLRVGTKDSTDTLRARIKKKLDDVHNYDIYLPSLVRMPESSCLEDHHIKERVHSHRPPFIHPLSVGEWTVLLTHAIFCVGSIGAAKEAGRRSGRSLW